MTPSLRRGREGGFRRGGVSFRKRQLRAGRGGAIWSSETSLEENLLGRPGCPDAPNLVLAARWPLGVPQPGKEAAAGRAPALLSGLATRKGGAAEPGAGSCSDWAPAGQRRGHGQYDSGIESLRSLRSLPEPTSAPASGPSDGGPQPCTHPPGPAEEPQEKEDADGERADSTYGSSSLTETLSLLGGPEAEDPAPRSPLPHAGALSPQQLEALTYISEDGDT
ncbi:hypothetical protein P7K49_008051 [Saguinus oedipus]|uniref:Uncharacterized protein n=1 Tax=Saguinus oedipus TaxID=9490 RepID=A0ABQ9VX79_SAGOE|nr:hypothetical protein P7K49_008051 [Saguinus oedipus]